jgi:galactoside O-acetyltransferase
MDRVMNINVQGGVSRDFLECGERVKIYPLAKIVGSEHLTIGHDVMIDDSVFLLLGEGSTIGSWVHIACGATVQGSGKLTVGDFVGISSGVRIFTASDDLTKGSLTNPTVPNKYRTVKRAPVSIGKHAVIGSNSVVMAGAEIGDGVIVGACSFVPPFAKLDDYGIYVGCPVRKVGMRPRELVEANEARLRMEVAA